MALADTMLANARRLLAAGQVEKARPILEEVMRHDPANVGAMMQLGFIEGRLGRGERAEAWFRRCSEADPNNSNAHFNLSVALANQGRDEEACAALVRASQLEPGNAAMLLDLANAFVKLKRLDEAIEAQQRAVGLDPTRAAAFFMLGNNLESQGRAAEATEARQAALRLDPSLERARMNLAAGMNYLCADPALVLGAHRTLGDELVARAGTPRPHANSPGSGRVLRLGILSGDLRAHSCAYFLEPLLAGLDAERVEVTCYAISPIEDNVTARFKQLAARWRSVAGVSAWDADAMIRADGIDVLVECAGLFDNTRLDIMAMKPAPVQGTYLGYPNTTGLSTIDFRVVDSISDPPGMTDAFHVERLTRLDPCAWCFRPAADAPPVSPPPLQEAGCITFGAFNNLAKFSDETVDAWSGALLSVPGSRLLLKNQGVQDGRTFERVRGRFAARGVDQTRIERAEYTKGVREHLEVYARVDIQLDTYPYNGTTTTCESFWQGVPVVTWAGSVHAARVSASLLHAVGLGVLAAQGRDEFVRTAASLANDRERLASTRTGLRGMMERSVLRDEKGFGARFEAMLRAELARGAGARG